MWGVCGAGNLAGVVPVAIDSVALDLGCSEVRDVREPWGAGLRLMS